MRTACSAACRHLISVSAFVGVLFLAACANLQTVGRSSSIPAPTAVVVSTGSGQSAGAALPLSRMANGKAIHLDAQQRLVITTVRGFCAEPSPDALAAYASALGLSASDPTKKALVASDSLSSTAASIGLRTQSITLMRDALYRMCEAHLNGSLNQETMAQILDRSLDLTAVVLAIEQLTGAVAAGQAALDTTASSSTTAMLLANEQALEVAKKRLEQKEAAAAEAKTKHDQLAQEEAAKKADVETAQTKYQSAEGDAKTQAQEELDAATKLAQAAEKDALEAKDDLDEADEEVEDAKELLAEIQRTRDSAIADSKTRVSGSAKAGNVTVVTRGDAAIKDVAESVEAMVKTVLLKPGYINARCADSMMAGPKSASARDMEIFVHQKEYCIQATGKSDAQLNALMQQ